MNLLGRIFYLNISFDFDYFPLFIVMATAWLIPMLMSLFRVNKIPTVIIEIIAGYFIGRYLMDSFQFENIQMLEFLALTGFIFLMFMSGLEIDVDQILASFPRKKITYARFLKNPLLVGLAFFMLTLVISYTGTYIISTFVAISSVWYFSLIMITTSVGIIVPVLKSRGELKTRFGQMIILAAAVADILSIILFTFSVVIIKSGFRWELVYILSLFILFYILYYLVNHFSRIKIVKQIIYQLGHAASQITIRGTLFLLLLFIVLSQFLGKEVVLLGAFLGGLLLSVFLHKDRSLLLLKLDGMGYGFFIPIFFIMVGVKFDPRALLEFDNSLWIFLISLMIILYAAKVVPAFLWSRLFGKRKAFSGGILMASRLSLIIAASKIGLDLNIITPGINSCFIILAVFSCILSPTIYNYLNPQHIYRSDNTIIIGGSSTGVLLARRLQMHGKPSLIVEKNPERYQEIVSKGMNAVLANGKERETFERVILSPSNYVIVTSGSDNENVTICKNLRRNFNHDQVISYSGSSKTEQCLKQLEVDTLDVTRVIATTFENLILRPTTYHALVETFENYSVEEIKISNISIDGQQVKEVPFHKDGSLMLIKRGDDMHVPHGETYFKSGDTVFVFGTVTAIQDFREKFI